MQVFTLLEHANHVGIIAKMSHHAQFNLAIVGREEQATRLRNEGLANLLAVLATNRNIL